MARKKELGWPQKLARKLLEGFFHLCFLFRRTLRFDRRPALQHPCVIAVFHDEMVAAVEYFKHSNCASIASRNHNGYAVAQVIRRAGYQMVYGSTTKGGKEAFYELSQALSGGRSVVFTVDGSRGPRHVMKPGAVMLAKKQKVPLYLMRLHTSGPRLPFTWDRFQIPLPFANVKVAVQELDLGSGKRIKDLVDDATTTMQAM